MGLLRLSRRDSSRGRMTRGFHEVRRMTVGGCDGRLGKRTMGIGSTATIMLGVVEGGGWPASTLRDAESHLSVQRDRLCILRPVFCSVWSGESLVEGLDSEAFPLEKRTKSRRVDGVKERMDAYEVRFELQKRSEYRDTSTKPTCSVLGRSSDN